MTFCENCLQAIDLREQAVLMTLAEFFTFVMVLAVLWHMLPKSGPKHYRALAGLFLIGWALIIEEFLGMVLAVYTVAAVLIVQHLAMVSTPHTVHVFTVALAFIPGLLFVNMGFYFLYKQVNRRAEASKALETPAEGPTLEEALEGAGGLN